MLFSLEVLPAQEGDCLLLHWKDQDGDPRLAVIDGGPRRVYEDTLRKRLEEIKSKRKIDSIDLVMVSHVDTDHIVGIKKLFSDLQKEIEDHLPSSFRVKHLWHNTFNDILGDKIDEYYKTVFTAGFTASTGAEPNPALVAKLEAALSEKDGSQAASHEAYDIGLILAGHADARALRDSHAFLFKAHKIGPLNGPFKKDGNSTLITAELTPKPLEFHGLEVRVVGPMQAQIDALQTEFDKYLKDKKISSEAALAAYADDSIPNLSSLVCLVKMAGKSILLTGDARGDYLLEGLKQAGLLKNGPLKVDVLKVPHHGSDRNIDPDFFKAVVADTYVFSGNGVHGNPERATMEMLIEARGKNAEYDIILTYPIPDTDAERERENQKREEANKKKKNKKAVEHWDASKHSLASLFESTLTAGYKFKLKAGSPYKAELGDEKVGW